MSVVRDPTFTDRTVTGRSTACVCAGPDAPARVGDARSQRAHVPVRARARLAVSSRSREVPSIENASEVLDASVAREHRRVRLLRGGPLPVKAIAGRFDLGRPAISADGRTMTTWRPRRCAASANGSNHNERFWRRRIGRLRQVLDEDHRK
jgi:hypothetical protein